jgi:transcriptional repressor NrdR
VDSRLGADGFSVRRRRECVGCEYRFSTAEEVEILDLRIVKSDGRSESYQRDKIVNGLRRAFEKRPITQAGFKAMVGKIERDLQKLRRDELTSAQVGEVVMGHLKEIDAVAYIRFASVYRSFTDAGDFRKELANFSGGAKA